MGPKNRVSVSTYIIASTWGSNAYKIWHVFESRSLHPLKLTEPKFRRTVKKSIDKKCYFPSNKIKFYHTLYKHQRLLYPIITPHIQHIVLWKSTSVINHLDQWCENQGLRPLCSCQDCWGSTVYFLFFSWFSSSQHHSPLSCGL